MNIIALINASAVTVCACLISLVLTGQTHVKGYVYEDLNKNGKRDKREKGIPGVGVSNGIQVVQTNELGHYTLPIGNDNIIFVIKPSDYEVTQYRKQLPQFFYIHKPLGSPTNLRYKGVAPTGKLPASVDFPLIRAADTVNFTALIFGDPQPFSLQAVDFFDRGIVSEVAGIKNVRFGISLGDLVDNDLSLFEPYIESVSRVGIPWYNVMGNHDMNFWDAISDSVSDETFEAHFGPANYSFNYGNVHFIILDNVLYPVPRDRQRSAWDAFRKDQLDFVEEDLKYVDKSKLIVVSFHVPLRTGSAGASSTSPDRQRYFDLLKDFPHTLTLSAHTHLQRHNFYTNKDGWNGATPHHEYNAGTTSGDWYSGDVDEKGIPFATMRDGTQKGYAFIHFSGNQYVVDYKVAGKSKEHQMEIFTPKVVPSSWTDAKFFVNFFMGSSDDDVRCRVDREEWIKMTHTLEPDPSFLHLGHSWDYADSLRVGRRPNQAVASAHLWKTNIPLYLPVGEHTLEVKATDMFGRVFKQTKKFKVQRTKQFHD